MFIFSHNEACEWQTIDTQGECSWLTLENSTNALPATHERSPMNELAATLGGVVTRKVNRTVAICTAQKGIKQQHSILYAQRMPSTLKVDLNSGRRLLRM
ncbi:hypothetical protein HNO88_003704 [Novosphingobium chloroacetimidivorans]|uniref:Uncharacterized protein n=1 Tax=Novosphingobium chloroacetimidivorans TaxID=1428314 RepID=A0A7W7NXG7_9SPHN|nr:hypothetical protein [Novosphingobium chloroacetimidivorans]MBB4860361.1 hypothetical protein [Novosphingobium chloroacetimidivorans]